MDDAAGGGEDVTCKAVSGLESTRVSTQERAGRQNICTKASAYAAYGDASVRPQRSRKRNAVAFAATAADAIQRAPDQRSVLSFGGSSGPTNGFSENTPLSVGAPAGIPVGAPTFQIDPECR